MGRVNMKTKAAAEKVFTEVHGRRVMNMKVFAAFAPSQSDQNKMKQQMAQSFTGSNLLNKIEERKAKAKKRRRERVISERRIAEGKRKKITTEDLKELNEGDADVKMNRAKTKEARVTKKIEKLLEKKRRNKNESFTIKL